MKKLLGVLFISLFTVSASAQINVNVKMASHTPSKET